MYLLCHAVFRYRIENPMPGTKTIMCLSEKLDWFKVYESPYSSIYKIIQDLKLFICGTFPPWGWGRGAWLNVVIITLNMGTSLML